MLERCGRAQRLSHTNAERGHKPPSPDTTEFQGAGQPSAQPPHDRTRAQPTAATAHRRTPPTCRSGAGLAVAADVGCGGLVRSESPMQAQRRTCVSTDQLGRRQRSDRAISPVRPARRHRTALGYLIETSEDQLRIYRFVVGIAGDTVQGSGGVRRRSAAAGGLRKDATIFGICSSPRSSSGECSLQSPNSTAFAPRRRRLDHRVLTPFWQRRSSSRGRSPLRRSSLSDPHCRMGHSGCLLVCVDGIHIHLRQGLDGCWSDQQQVGPS